MILRIEDSDVRRSREDSALGIIDGLRWLGLGGMRAGSGGAFGPYRQSERLHIYSQYLRQLLEQDQAYYCFCTAEQLAAEREAARQSKKDYKYGGHCRHISKSEAKERIRNGERPVIRFKAPALGKVVVNDLIRGEVEFDNRLLDDFILAKSDGGPTYNFAVVVDDHCMAISCDRARTLIQHPQADSIVSSLGWSIPQFAHVSMILAPDRSKLSKRHGATSVQEFRMRAICPRL